MKTLFFGKNRGDIGEKKVGEICTNSGEGENSRYHAYAQPKVNFHVHAYHTMFSLIFTHLCAQQKKSIHANCWGSPFMPRLHFLSDVIEREIAGVSPPIMLSTNHIQNTSFYDTATYQGNYYEFDDDLYFVTDSNDQKAHFESGQHVGFLFSYMDMAMVVLQQENILSTVELDVLETGILKLCVRKCLF